MIKSFTGPDGEVRCHWCSATPAYMAYHDTEWGFPVTDDRRLFEKICLEGFQSGLSWLTILNKRENFRTAFNGFDFNIVARYGEAEIRRLLDNPGIIRHRGKIEATINNAARARELVAETGSLAAYFWRYEPAPAHDSGEALVATSAESVALSKDLKKRGWKFVGPTTAYAFMQAMGLVNDHALDCAARERVAHARAAATKPGH
jgi:DNA-3-methyladenine glycosylase I